MMLRAGTLGWGFSSRAARWARASCFLSLLLFFASSVAAAREPDVRPLSDDVRVTLRADGKADIERRVRYRVLSKPARFFEMDPFVADGDAPVEATIASDRGDPVEGRAVVDPSRPGTLRIYPAPPASRIARGGYAVQLGYRVDLRATGLLARDGATWLLSWRSPAWNEGRDGARVVFDVASAPMGPRLANSDDTHTMITSLHTTAEGDELELVRPHVPRGEAVTWTVRVDPKALPALAPVAPDDATPRTTPDPPHARYHALISLTALTALVGLYGFTAWLLFRWKDRWVSSLGAQTGLRFRRFLPDCIAGLPPAGHSLAGFAFATTASSGFAALLAGPPVAGAGLLAMAMSIGAYQPPIFPDRTPLSDGERVVSEGVTEGVDPAAVPLKPHLLDASTRRGRLGLAAVLVATALLAVGARGFVAGAEVAVSLAALALLPLWVTGTQSQLRV